jgi:hypothetical protein
MGCFFAFGLSKMGWGRDIMVIAEERMDSRLAIQLHAKQRRLEAAGASKWMVGRIIAERGAMLDEAMRVELKRSVELTGAARSVLLEDPNFNRAANEDDRPRFSLRSMQSRFLMVGGVVCYTVRDLTITTTIKIEERQLRQVLAHTDPFSPDAVSPMIAELVQWASGLESRRPVNVTPKPREQRAELKAPRWLREPGATWEILTLEDRPSHEKAMALGIRWFRDTKRLTREETVFAETTSLSLFGMRNWITQNGTVRMLLHVPQLTPLGNRAVYVQDVQRWWNSVFNTDYPHTNRLFMVTSPASAHAILELLESCGVPVSFSSDQKFVSGTVLTLIWSTGADRASSVQVTVSEAN